MRCRAPRGPSGVSAFAFALSLRRCASWAASESSGPTVLAIATNSKPVSSRELLLPNCGVGTKSCGEPDFDRVVNMDASREGLSTSSLFVIVVMMSLGGTAMCEGA